MIHCVIISDVSALKSHLWCGGGVVTMDFYQLCLNRDSLVYKIATKHLGINSVFMRQMFSRGPK